MGDAMDGDGSKRAAITSGLTVTTNPDCPIVVERQESFGHKPEMRVLKTDNGA